MLGDNGFCECVFFCVALQISPFHVSWPHRSTVACNDCCVALRGHLKAEWCFLHEDNEGFGAVCLRKGRHFVEMRML